MEKYECKLCKRNISKKGFGSHLKNKHNITGKQYYDKFLKLPNDDICSSCKQKTKFLGISKGYQTFCSYICAASNEITKEKNRNKNLGKKRYDIMGDKNPAKKPEVRKRISELMKKRWADKNDALNSKTYRKKLSKSISKANKGKTYEERYGYRKSEELKEVRRKQLLDGQAQDMCRKIIHPSKPQLILFEKIKSVFPDAILEYRVGNYSLDIAIPNKKIDIEYDCSYWHKPEKDLRRDTILKSIGWKIIRFVDRIPTKKEILQIN